MASFTNGTLPSLMTSQTEVWPTMTSDSNVTSEMQSVNDRHNPVEWMQVFCPVALSIDRFITPIWYIIGITGNILSFKVWMDKRMRSQNSSAVYLATLSISDLAFLLLHIMQELKYAWGRSTLSYPVICEGYFFLILVVQYLSPILVMGFSVERWIAVCHPFSKEKYCTVSRALRVVLGLVFISMTLCAMQSYFWMYDSAKGECVIRPAAIEGGKTSIWAIWTWITEMLIFLIVPVVTLVFNIQVIREVRRISGSGLVPGQPQGGGSQQPTSRATTVMLLSVSFYVIFTTLPATFVYVLFEQFSQGDPLLTDQQILEDPIWTRYRVYVTSRKIVEEICLSHYACNIFLYTLTGHHFRKALINTFRCTVFAAKNKANGNYSEISQKILWNKTYTSRV